MIFFQTILEDSNGASQNSRSFDRGGSPSNLITSATAAGIAQNQSSGSVQSPYFPASSNTQSVPACSQLATQAVVRSTMQLHQMVSCQLSGQTVAMSTMTTQASQSQSSLPVIQPVVPQLDRSSALVQDMMWVS